MVRGQRLLAESDALATENEKLCVRVFWHQFDTSVLCGLALGLVADPAERRGRHRTPYKLPLT